MNYLYKIIVLFLVSVCFAANADAQSAVRYNNSFRLQYGLFQYNTNQQSFINENNENLLSIGLTFRHQLGAVSGLNFTGRYYQWNLKNNQDLKTYAAQAMWVFHLKRVSSGWRLNKFTPYAGVGVGVENHNIEKTSASDSSFTKLYVPFEAGILYNLSSRISVGVFAEYKISTAPDIKKLVNAPEGNRDIVNAAGISVAWHFGKRKSNITVPIVTSNPFLTNSYFEKKDNEAATIFEPNVAVDLRDQAPVVTVPSPEIPDLNDTIYKNKTVSVDTSDLISADTILFNQVDTVTNNNAVVKMDSVSIKDSNLIKDTIIAQKKMKGDTARINLDSALVVNKIKNGDTVINKIDTLFRKNITAQQKDNLVVEKKVMPKQNLSADSLLKALSEEKEIGINRDRKLDTLSKIIEQLNNKVDRLATLQTVPEKEKVVIQSAPVAPNDEPVVKRLKTSYNELGQQIDQNYQRGYINNVEVQRLKREADDVNNNIGRLSAQDYNNYENLAEINRRIAAMQFQVSRYNDEAIKLNRNDYNVNRNDYNDRDINSLHYKLDKTLMELQNLKPSTPTVEIKTDSSNINNLISMQQQLQQKLAEVEKQNLQLKNEIEKIGEKSPTAPPAPVPVKEENNVLYTVLFAVNSSLVNKTDKDILLQKIAGLQVAEGQMILLSGFADKTGNAAYNLKLSQKRVQAVKAELLKHGFKKEAIVERYFGSEKATESASDNDRKVVVRIINN